jgi:hypothetical protein
LTPEVPLNMNVERKLFFNTGTVLSIAKSFAIIISLINLTEKDERVKKKRDVKSKNGKDIAFKRQCPFVEEPFDDCYCVSMNSMNVKGVIFYCGGNFENCEIYRRSMKLNTRES